jgi:hypothetical protein
MNRSALVLTLIVVGLWPTTGARAAPTNFLGVNAHQPATDVLDAAADLGVGWVRIDLNWFQAQPTAGQPPDFTIFDKMVNEALARGLAVFPTIGYGPAWASEPDSDGKPHNDVPKAGEYEKFCQAVAAHYQGKITHLGLWNEPNLDFFEGTRQQWIDRILVEGIAGIKAGCPSCKVLGPELASVGSDYAVWLDDALKQLKQKGVMFDVVTWHIYSGFIELKPSWICWDGDLFIHDLDQHRVCFGFHGPLSVREVLLNNGLGNLPVWISETGYTAPVGDATATASQVTYYRRVIEEQLKRPWWTHTFFYEIVDDNLIPDKWGMAVRNGTSYPASYQTKPVWAFVQGVLAKQPALGGSGTDCDDGLDNDGDKLIDYPADPECASASGGVDGPSPADGPSATDGMTDAPGADQAAVPDGPAGSDAPAAGDGPAADGGTSGGGDGDGCGCALGARPRTPLALALVPLLALSLVVRRRGSTRR